MSADLRPLPELYASGVYWLPVPTGGRYLADLGRSASYAAASRGDLPTLTVGARRIVIVADLMRALGVPVPGDDQAPASTPAPGPDHHGGGRDASEE